MSDYVPVEDIEDLAVRAEIVANTHPDGSKARRFGKQMAEDIRKCIDENRRPASKVPYDE